jgi:hypothetical protein
MPSQWAGWPKRRGLLPSRGKKFSPLQNSIQALRTTQGLLHYVQEIPSPAGKDLLRKNDHPYRPKVKTARRFTSMPHTSTPICFPKCTVTTLPYLVLLKSVVSGLYYMVSNTRVKSMQWMSKHVACVPSWPNVRYHPDIRLLVTSQHTWFASRHFNSGSPEYKQGKLVASFWVCKLVCIIRNRFIKVSIKRTFNPTVAFYGREIWTYGVKKNKLNVVERGTEENICS